MCSSDLLGEREKRCSFGNLTAAVDFTSLNLGLLKLKKIEMEENKLEKMKRKAVKFKG